MNPAAAHFPMEYAAGGCDALHRLRRIIPGGDYESHSAADEDLALLEEMRLIRPGVKCIITARHSTPDKWLPPFAHAYSPASPLRSIRGILHASPVARHPTASARRRSGSMARPGWVSVRVNCRMITAERLMTFANEFSMQLPEANRRDMMHAFREILLNAMEHGAAFNPEQVVEVTAVRTGRALVFYIRDPGSGFRRESLAHAAIANPADDPVAHIMLREKEGMAGGIWSSRGSGHRRRVALQ